MLPHKILKFRVWEMPSPGFFAGYFQLTLHQKCSRKLFILTISSVFSVSYSYENNCQYARSCVYVYEVLLGSSIFRPSSYFAEEILVY